MADEATTKRVTPESFAKWGVSELAAQSDLWLNQQGRITHPMVLPEGAQPERTSANSTISQAIVFAVPEVHCHAGDFVPGLV